MLSLVLALSSTLAAQELALGQPGTFPVADIQGLFAKAEMHKPFTLEAPFGITSDLAARLPADNPFTRAKVELGLQLFFDARLSADGTRACATCHHPDRGWASPGAPTIVNRILGKTQYGDGRVDTLEAQAEAALSNARELASTPADVVARVNAIEGYRLEFQAVFGAPATPETLARALAAFERTIVAGDSLNDVYDLNLPFLEEGTGDDAVAVIKRRGAQAAIEARPMSEAALRGRELFLGAARCSACHTGENLTDEAFHNLGVGANPADLGRFGVTKVERDRGAFRTPGLRDVRGTAPYMHDGSLATLADVVEFYDRGGVKNPQLSERMAPLGLSAEQKADLVRFLEEGLASAATPVGIPRLP